MGLFSLVGSLIGSGSQKKASKKAAQAQIDALNAGIAEERRQYDTTRSDFTPYREAGASALGQMGDLIGLHGDSTQDASINKLKQSALYQSLFGTGEEAVLQNASATGGIRGGNTQTALADFGRDTLAQTIQQQLANLGGISSLGEGATASGASFGQNTANAVTSLLGAQGDARASDILNRGGINAQNWNNIGKFVDQAVSSFLPGAGAAGAAGAATSGGGFSSLFKF